MDRENIDEVLNAEARSMENLNEIDSGTEAGSRVTKVSFVMADPEEDDVEYVFDLTDMPDKLGSNVLSLGINDWFKLTDLENVGYYVRRLDKEEPELKLERDIPTVRIEICDLYELAYDVEDLDCEYLIIPLRLLKEISYKLSPRGMRLFFDLYHGTWEDGSYYYEVDENALKELVDKGYLEMRADGKYIFYLSAVDYKLESMGERLGGEDWDVDHSCVSDL